VKAAGEFSDGLRPVCRLSAW